jgi:hypothetical protein
MCQHTEFTIDQEAVRDLVEEKIGLRLPVEVHLVDDVDFEDEDGGDHGFIPDDDPAWGRLWVETDLDSGTVLFEAMIHVLKGLPAEAVVRTILHEVEHLRQYFLDGDNIMQVYLNHQADLKTNGYYRAGYEIKAMNAEREWLHRGNLLLGR